MFIKDSNGDKSWSITIAVISFFITTAVIVYGIVIGQKLDDHDSTLIQYMGACFALYWGRRVTKSKVDKSE